METKNTSSSHSEWNEESRRNFSSNSFTNQHPRSKNYHGFTLVELIVVITILVILWTIWFISIQGFAGSARDSVRTSDISNVMKALELFQVKTGSYPAPTGAVIVYTGGVSGGNIVQQWIINGSLIGLSPSSPIDPLTKTPYTYSILGNGLYYQIGGELESPLSSNFKSPFMDSAFADSKTALVKWNYFPDPSLPSLIVISSSVPTTAWSGGVFSPEVCFVTNGSSSNLVSGGGNGCLAKKGMVLKDMDSGLVGYWDMETLSGTMLKDLSGNGNEGSFSGGMSSTGSLTGGVVGMGRSFDGTGNFINITASDSLNLQNNFSLSTLMNPKFYTPNSGFFVVISDDNSINRKYYLAIYPNEGLITLICDNGKTAIKSTTAVNFNTWSNISITYATGIAKIFINGTLINNNTYACSLSANTFHRIGAHGANSHYFQWIIDDIKIYNRALSDAEIKQHARVAGF